MSDSINKSVKWQGTQISAAEVPQSYIEKQSDYLLQLSKKIESLLNDLCTLEHLLVAASIPIIAGNIPFKDSAIPANTSSSRESHFSYLYGFPDRSQPSIFNAFTLAKFFDRFKCIPTSNDNWNLNQPSQHSQSKNSPPYNKNMSLQLNLKVPGNCRKTKYTAIQPGIIYLCGGVRHFSHKIFRRLYLSFWRRRQNFNFSTTHFQSRSLCRGSKHFNIKQSLYVPDSINFDHISTALFTSFSPKELNCSNTNHWNFQT